MGLSLSAEVTDICRATPPSRVRVVTDTGADLDAEVLARHTIGIVPLDVRLGDIGPEVTSKWTPEEFWQNCAKYPELAETSAPSPGAFAEMFSSLAAEGAEGIVCVTLSSKLSATYQSAVLGAATVADRVEVRVVDSLLATVRDGDRRPRCCRRGRGGRGPRCRRGRRHLEPGADRPLRDARLLGQPAQERAPRIGPGALGRPARHKAGPRGARRLLELESRPRTRSRSLEYLAERAWAARDLERLAVVHAGAADVGAFVELLGTSFPKERITVDWLGPVIGAHVGQGTIAVVEQRRPAPAP